MAKKEIKKNSSNEIDGKIKVYKVNGAAKKEEARMRRERNIQTFLIALIVILAIAAVFSAIQTFFPDLFGKFSLSGELAAKVNGKPITMLQLNNEYERLPLQYKYILTKELFLKQLIDETLLTEEAARQGIAVSEQEVDENLNQFMKDNNVTQDKLDEILKTKKLTYQELRSLVKNQLVIDKLLKQSVKDKMNVTDAQALQYYNDNPKTFTVPEMMTAKHILIGLANRTQEEAKSKAEAVLKQLKSDNSNFCELVEKNSDDSGSVDKCGEYTFPRGQMVEEFEKAAFEQGIGKVSIVNTTFGYHIIWTLNKTPEQLILFDGVKDQIILVLAQQQEKMIYSDLIVSLREKATIINYLEQEAEEAAKKAEAEAKAEENKTEGTAEEGSGKAAETKVNVIEPAEEPEEEAEAPIEEEKQISEEQKELEKEIEPSVEEVTEEEPTETTEPEVQPVAKVGLAQCLTDKGAVLYGAYWDSSTKKQKESFGADVSKITYVECGVQGDYRSQTEGCTRAGILAYPTWVVGKQKYMGIQELAQLATLTGCTI